MVHGTLEIHAVAARNIKKAKVIGKPNPYLIMRIDSNKQRTRSANQNTDPTWNEKFVFDIINNQTSVFIEVFDDMTGTDDLLGVASVDLASTFQTGTLDTWVEITRLQTGQPAGQVRLVFYFRGIKGLGLNQPAPAPTTVVVQQAPPAPQPQQVIMAAGPQPVYAQAPQPMYAQAPQPMYAQAPQPMYAQAPQPTYVAAPQPMYAAAPQPMYAQAPQPMMMAPAPQQMMMAPSPQPVFYGQPMRHY